MINTTNNNTKWRPDWRSRWSWPSLGVSSSWRVSPAVERCAATGPRSYRGRRTAILIHKQRWCWTDRGPSGWISVLTARSCSRLQALRRSMCLMADIRRDGGRTADRKSLRISCAADWRSLPDEAPSCLVCGSRSANPAMHLNFLKRDLKILLSVTFSEVLINSNCCRY